MDNNISNFLTKKETIDALWRLQKIILDTLNFNEVVERVVNSILTELGYLNLGYRILVLTLIDKEKQVLKRIALSQTQEAQGAVNASPIPFESIEIPLTASDNLLIKSITDQKPYITHYWPDLFRPILTDQEALLNQTSANIQTSLVYPLIVKGTSIGAMIFSLIKSEKEVSQDEKDMLARFTDMVGLAVQNSQLYSSIQEKSKQLEAANDRLKDLDKMKDEFVSLASHELRTPMTSISSYTWLLLEQKFGPVNDKQKIYLQNTLTSITRLSNLVNDMLNVSRIEAGRITINPQPLNMDLLTQAVLMEVQPKAQEQGLNLIVDKPATPLPNVLADQDKIKEVMINLIGNSMKFTPSGGKITISFSEKDGFVETHITDTGKGIKSEDVPKLFKKFGMIEGNYLKTVVGQGTGLGLYICKSLIELHGGTIWFHSDGENMGSTFSFSLKKA